MHLSPDFELYVKWGRHCTALRGGMLRAALHMRNDAVPGGDLQRRAWRREMEWDGMGWDGNTSCGTQHMGREASKQGVRWWVALLDMRPFFSALLMSSKEVRGSLPPQWKKCR